jgi:predicted O-methyltransferase YrrM
MAWLLTRYRLPTVHLEDLVGMRVTSVDPILDDVCMPPYFGAEHDDFTPLVTIARWLRPRLVLELGTAHGNTVANLCREIDDCRVYTVDAPAEMQSGVLTTYKLKVEEIGRVYRDRGYGSRVVQILRNTLELDLSEYLQPTSVDLAIIDACHDTAYVLNDFSKVEPYVRPGGVVLFHDTHPSMSAHLGGSYRACLFLRRKGFDVRHIANTWWAFWSRGSAAPLEQDAPVSRQEEDDACTRHA